MTRTRVSAALLVVAFAVAATTSAVAQEKGKRPQGGGGPGGGSLLGSPDVQKDLKISEDQVKKIEDARGSMRDAFAGFQDLSMEERNKKMAEVTAEIRKKTEAVLTADQLKRLNELKFQQVGAVNNPEVQTALKVTDEQKSKLTALGTEYGEKRRGLFQGAGGGGQGGFSPEMREKMTALSKEQDEKALGLLTAEQKSALEKGKGAKADYQLPPYATFGGGGRRPNNNN